MIEELPTGSNLTLAGKTIPVEGEPQADPDRAPTRTRVPQGEPPGRGGAAVRCRCQVARRGVGFGAPGTARGRARRPRQQHRQSIEYTSFGYTSPRAAPLISGVANDWSGRYPPRRLSRCCRFARGTCTGTQDSGQDARRFGRSDPVCERGAI